MNTVKQSDDRIAVLLDLNANARPLLRRSFVSKMASTNVMTKLDIIRKGFALKRFKLRIFVTKLATSSASMNML